MKKLDLVVFRALRFDRSVTLRIGIGIVLIFAVIGFALMIDRNSAAQSVFPSANPGVDQRPKTDTKRDTKPMRIPNYDIRLSGAKNVNDLMAKTAPNVSESSIALSALRQRANIENGLTGLQKKAPLAEADLSPLTGAFEIVRSTDGLTRPDSRIDGFAIVRDFMTNNQELYGLSSDDIADLNFIGESVSPGLRMVRIEQIVNERPIFQSETRFILDRQGRIIRSLGSMIPQASVTESSLDDLLSPQEALRRTMEPLGVSLDAEKIDAAASDTDPFGFELNANDPRIGNGVTSKVVYFPLAPGVLVPAWSQIVFGVDEDWYVLVDARDGTLLWRKNIRSDASTHDARFRVYVQADGTTPADNPAPQSPSAALPGAGTQFPEIAPTIVTMFTAQNITASQNGWIDDCPGGVCTANETQTLGNNVLACVDRTAGATNVCDTAGISALDGNGRPIGNTDPNGRARDFFGTTPQDFQTGYLPAPQGGNPEAGTTASSGGAAGTQFLRGSVVHQFYVANWYHDKLFALGFNEAAGNFQQTNFSGFGVAGDRVLVDVQDGQTTNNANFATPPDGTSGRAQMFNFSGPTVDRDGGLDTEILIHELTHGTSNRIIGNAAGLTWDVGRSMGEGWSDFYALALLNNTNADNPNSNYASGAYATYKLATVTFLDNYVYGIRRFPYSTNNSVNPLTWGDLDQTTYDQSGGIAVNPLGFEFGGALEVHNAGEIWTNTLWEMRARIIADPAGANGSVPTGNQTTLQLVTDGMKLTPANPSFIQARDALIDADCTTNACANEQSIWDAFADRGLGYGAKVPNSVVFTPGPSGHIGVAESFLPANLDVNTVVVNDTMGNSSGFIDANEPVRVFVNLKNPWRHASKTATGVSATISSSTPGVSILSATTTYPNIGPNSNAAENGDLLTIRAPLAATCGTKLEFTLTISSSLGAVARNFTIRMGQPTGTLAPVTYTRSALALAIPNNAAIGVTDSMTITDDFEIADLNVRIDSLTHTNVSQLTFGIRGPNGYGTDVLSFIGGAVPGGNAGDNFTNTVFDDESANDVLLEPPANQPFTNSFQPVYNSPTWDLITGFPPAEATPQLTNFDGISTLGTWRATASDQVAATAGAVLQGWSLIVTPRAFTCTPFAPTAASVGISGRVISPEGRGVKGAVVTLTNAAGVSRQAMTNVFGFYAFFDVPAGESYTVTAKAKRYQFTPRVITLTDELTGLDLTAEP